MPSRRSMVLRVIVCVAILVGYFLYTTLTHAATIGNITVGTGISGNTAVTIGTSTVAISPSGTYHITAINWNMTVSSGTCTLEAPHIFINGTNVGQSDFAYALSDGDNEVALATPIDVSGSSFQFYFKTDGTPDGSTWYSGGSCTVNSAQFVYDSSTLDPFLNITGPANGSSGIDPNFNVWLFEYNLSSTTNSITSSTPGVLRFAHGKTPSTMFILDDTYRYSQVVDVGETIHGNIDLPGTWYAQAYLFDYATSTYVGSTLLTSPLISYTTATSTTFAVNPCGLAGEELSTTSISSALFGSLWLAVRHGFCEAGVILFSPSPESLGQWQQAGTILSQKPPFGYFGAVSSGLSGISSTSTTSTVVMTTTTAAALDPLFGPVKTGLSFLTLTLAGFWLYHRFSLISLHG